MCSRSVRHFVLPLWLFALENRFYDFIDNLIKERFLYGTHTADNISFNIARYYLAFNKAGLIKSVTNNHVISKIIRILRIKPII